MFYRFEPVKYLQIRRLKLENTVEPLLGGHLLYFRDTGKWLLNECWPLSGGLSQNGTNFSININLF